MESILTTVDRVFLFAALLLVLVFPGYVLFFIIRRIRLRKKGILGAAPSFGTFAVYSLTALTLLVAMTPGFRGYAAKKRRHEAEFRLAAIATAHISYRAEHGDYSGLAGNPRIFETVGYVPAPGEKRRYSLYCGSETVEQTAFSYDFPKPGPSWPFDISPAVSPSGFTCMAVGNIDSDSYMDVWIVDENRDPKNIINDLGSEATSMEANGSTPRFDASFLDRAKAVLTYREDLILVFFHVLAATLVVLLFKDSKRYRRAMKSREENSKT